MSVFKIKSTNQIKQANIFRHGDDIYVDLGTEQYCFSLKKLQNLEDMDLRSNSVSFAEREKLSNKD